MEYNATELRERASKLYAKARWYRWITAFMGAVVGVLLAIAYAWRVPDMVPAVVCSWGALGGLWGWCVGDLCAAWTGMLAQSALCLLEMAQRTRQSAGAAPAAS